MDVSVHDGNGELYAVNCKYNIYKVEKVNKNAFFRWNSSQNSLKS
jgi:hypothetical protein